MTFIWSHSIAIKEQWSQHTSKCFTVIRKWKKGFYKKCYTVSASTTWIGQVPSEYLQFYSMQKSSQHSFRSISTNRSAPNISKIIFILSDLIVFYCLVNLFPKINNYLMKTMNILWTEKYIWEIITKHIILISCVLSINFHSFSLKLIIFFFA